MAALAAAILLAGATPTAVGALPNGFTDTFVANVESPTSLAFTPDGRLLVTTQFGQVRLVDGGPLLADPVLDLAGALCTADEMGLLGARDRPGFAGERFRLSLLHAFQVRPLCQQGLALHDVRRDDRHRVELVLVDEIPATGNHNAGDLRFGNDGFST